METLNIPERKEKIKWDYDAEADMLYISFGTQGMLKKWISAKGDSA
jgi:uncharacterized protein YuzE